MQDIEPDLHHMQRFVLAMGHLLLLRPRHLLRTELVIMVAKGGRRVRLDESIWMQIPKLLYQTEASRPPRRCLRKHPVDGEGIRTAQQ